MLVQELENILCTKKLEKLLEGFTSEADSPVNSEILSSLEIMLRSDSAIAFDMAAFIIKSNRQYSALLLPVIVDLCSVEDSKWGNRTQIPRQKDLLLAILSLKSLEWKLEYNIFVLDFLWSRDISSRYEVIRTVIYKFDEIFPNLYHQFFDVHYDNDNEALGYVQNQYEKSVLMSVEKGDMTVFEYTDAFWKWKRIVRSLYIILLIKTEGLLSAKHKICDEDSFIFDQFLYSTQS